LGHPSEDETGLTYMRARYYDPAVGRFISEDQERDGGNWFEYARSSPTTRVDRTGHFGVLELIVGVLVGIALVVGFELGLEAGERDATEVHWTKLDSFVAIMGGVLGKDLAESAATMLGSGMFAAAGAVIFAAFTFAYGVGFFVGVDSAPLPKYSESSGAQ